MFFKIMSMILGASNSIVVSLIPVKVIAVIKKHEVPTNIKIHFSLKGVKKML
jgi:hypothetical protein